MIEVEHKSKFNLTKVTLYFPLICKLWDVYCEDLVEIDGLITVPYSIFRVGDWITDNKLALVQIDLHAKQDAIGHFNKCSPSSTTSYDVIGPHLFRGCDAILLINPY